MCRISCVEKLLEVKQDINLAGFTTLGIGGNARFFVRAKTETHVTEAVKFAETNSLKLFVLGGGSNVLVSDAGFDGLVLQIGVKGIELRENGAITAAAGEDWDDFVAHCVRNDLAGVECLSGIPGLVGGTPVQNVGAYGQEVSETIVSVRCFDRAKHTFVTLARGECGFTYRTSIFNSTERDRYIVLSVSYSLVPGGAPKIAYPELERAIANSTTKSTTLREVRDKILEIRRAKSMVIDADDPNSKSAGSFFKNPIVEKDKFEEMRIKYAKMPFFEFGESFKIPAAWLIENAGFHKGFTHGDAGISSKHTLALINRGGATAAELISLKQKIEQGVWAEFDIELQMEPVFVGF